MRRSPSPVKRRILSQFFNKFSNKKQSSQSVHLSQQKPPQIIKRKSLTISQIRNKQSNNTSYFFQQQLRNKPIQKSIDDMLSFTDPVNKKQKYMREHNKKSQLYQQQHEQIQRQKQTQNDIKDKQVSLQVSQQSINVNTSISFLQNQTKTIQTLKTQNQIHIKEKQLHIKEKQHLQQSLKQKQDQVEEILRQRSLSMSKKYKLEQDLLKKEKQLNRRVGQINVFNMERQGVANFLINFSKQIEEFMKEKQDIVKEQRVKQQQRQLTRSSKSHTKSLSVLKHGLLQSISEDKEISFIQKINLKTLDQLMKSIPKGYNQNQVSTNAQKLINTFKRFIDQIKKSQSNLLNNLKQQNLKLQKQFENQKILINRIQKQLQNEKIKCKKLQQNQNQVIQELRQLKNIHDGCEIEQNKDKKQIQSLMKKIEKHSYEIKTKQNKIQQLSQRVKKLQTQINQIQSLIQKQTNKHKQQLATKDNKIQQLNYHHKQQLRTKQQQTLEIKKQFNSKQDKESIKKQQQNLQKRIKLFQSTQKSTKQLIRKLKQQLLKKQQQINQRNILQTKKQKSLKQNQKQLQSIITKLNQKQIYIKKMQAQLSKKDKKIFQIQFLNSQMKKDLIKLRNQLINTNLKLAQSTRKQNQLKVNTEYLQRQNSSLIQEIKTIKSKQQIKQKKHKQIISTLQQNILQLQKLIYQLQFKLKIIEEQKKILLQTQNKNKKLIQQMQMKIKLMQSLTQTHNYKSIEKDQILKRIKLIYEKKQIQLNQQKDKIIQNERKLFEQKISCINQLYWKQKQSNFNLIKQNELLRNQNEQKKRLVDFLNAGIIIIDKNLAEILKRNDKKNKIKDSLQVNQLDKKNNDKITQQQIQKILSQDEPQFFYSILNMKLESKMFIKIFSNLYQVDRQLRDIEKIRQIEQKNKLDIQRIKDFIQTKRNDLIIVIEKIAGNSDQNEKLIDQQLLQFLLSPINESIDITSNKQLTQLSQMLFQFISIMNETFTKYHNSFIGYKNRIQSIYRKQKLSLQNQIEQINQRNQHFTTLLTNIQSKYYSQLGNSKTIQDVQKLLNENIQNKLIQKQTFIQTLNNKTSQLNNQFILIKQRQIKLNQQIIQIQKQLHQQKQSKIKLHNQLKTLKQQLYRFKQYQMKKIQEKCNELSIQLQYKNKQLKQAYLFAQRHLNNVSSNMLHENQ